MLRLALRFHQYPPACFTSVAVRLLWSAALLRYRLNCLLRLHGGLCRGLPVRMGGCVRWIRHRLHFRRVSLGSGVAGSRRSGSGCTGCSRGRQRRHRRSIACIAGCHRLRALWFSISALLFIHRCRSLLLGWQRPVLSAISTVFGRSVRGHGNLGCLGSFLLQCRVRSGNFCGAPCFPGFLRGGGIRCVRRAFAGTGGVRILCFIRLRLIIVDFFDVSLFFAGGFRTVACGAGGAD